MMRTRRVFSGYVPGLWKGYRDQISLVENLHALKDGFLLNIPIIIFGKPKAKTWSFCNCLPLISGAGASVREPNPCVRRKEASGHGTRYRISGTTEGSKECSGINLRWLGVGWWA